MVGLDAGSCQLRSRRAEPHHSKRLAEPLIDVGLFRGRAFSSALGATVIGMFVTYGMFFFVAQYFQLSLGLSPLEAGLWGLPGVAAMMIAGGGVVPQLAQRVKPGILMAGGLVVSAIGFGLLATLDAGDGLELVVPALVLASVGLAPGVTLGTNLMVGAAPPERSGAASGLAETGNELAGALGIALLGTLGTALYRNDVRDAIPADAAPGVADAARDTLGGAVSVADRLPAGALDAAEAAFGSGLSVVATTCAVLVAGAAVATAVLLRHVPSAVAPGTADDEPAAEPVRDAERERVPVLAG